MNENTNNKNKLKLVLLIFIFASLFLAIFLIDTKVRLYGDDWFYHTFSSSTFLYYVRRNIGHYFFANGRSIVHVLVTAFLKLPMICWVVTNAMFLVTISIVFVIMSNFYEGENIDKYIYSALLMVFCISTLDGYLTSQSVYWLTGSFNYVYPIFTLCLFMYFYYNRKNTIHWYLFLLGFVAGASVEQAGMMAFGFVLLNTLYNHFILKRKVNKRDIFLVIVVLIGLLSVLLAPGTFHRVSISDTKEATMLSLLFDNAIIQMNTFLLSNMMFPTHILTIVASITAIIKRAKIGGSFNIFEKTVTFLGIISSLTILLFNIYGTGYVQNNYSSVIWLIILSSLLLGYVLLLGYSAYILYFYGNYKRRILPTILLIIAFGSQFMMIVSPTYGNRNIIFAIFPLALYSVIVLIWDMKFDLLLLIFGIYYFVTFSTTTGIILLLLFLISHIVNKYFYEKQKVVSSKWLIIVAIVGLLTARNFLPTYHGYSMNAMVYDNNLIEVSNYDENSGKPLVQTKMNNYKYRWVMPYENPYYAPYYNLYINMDKDQIINWTY